jgi:hypothetical protein
MSSRYAFAHAACFLTAFAAGFHPIPAAAADTAPALKTGIVLDRLSQSEIRQWRSIEHLVDVSAPNGTPLYPTLRGLWEWARHGGNAIYIELSSPDCAAMGTAGKFLIERVDPQAARHVGVIRLCLGNIDRRVAGGGGTRAIGFVRLAGLHKTERYAEVLGHELAHAAYDFANPERARMVQERVEAVSAQFVTHRTEHGNEPLDPALQQRLEERDAMLDELEAHADSIELLVWRELTKRGPS